MQAATQLSTSRSALRGTALQQRTAASRYTPVAASVEAATQVVTRRLKAGDKPRSKPPPPPKKNVGTASKTVGGTRTIKGAGAGKAKKTVGGTQRIGGTRPAGTQSIELFSTEKRFRPKQDSTRPAPKILSRVEQLRLLSKLEQAGLLSLAEKNGLTLSAIEKSGLLSKAESLGLISAAADRNTPSALFTLAALLLAGGPALVYFVPDDSTALVVAQVLGAALCVLGGSAAWGGASLLASLQK